MPNPWMLGLMAASLVLPAWSAQAGGDDMLSYYPPRAQRMGMDGHASLSCTVTADGHLKDCSVASEDPAGYGFGEAALKLAHLFKMKPETVDGKPVDGAHIVVPIAFKAPT